MAKHKPAEPINTDHSLRLEHLEPVKHAGTVFFRPIYGFGLKLESGAEAELAVRPEKLFRGPKSFKIDPY
jgi:hypothetical protein